MTYEFQISWTHPDGDQSPVAVKTRGVKLGTFTVRNMATDEWPLTIRVQPGDADVIPERAVVVIWQKIDGSFVRVFTGEAGPTETGETTEGGESQRVTLRGPWHQLSKAVYHRGDQDELLYPGNLPLAPSSENSWNFLGDYCAAYLADWLSFPTFADSGLTNVYELTVQGLGEQSISACLQALMINYPHAALVFDYSTEVPTLNVVERDEDVVIIPHNELLPGWRLVKNDNYVASVVVRKTFPWTSYSELPSPIEIPQFVKDQCGTGFEKSIATDVYPIGGPIDGPNVVHLSTYWLQYEFVPAGGLEFIYDLLSLRFFTGSFTIKGTSRAIQPGSTVSLAGTKFSDANATVLSVTRNYATHETSIEIGINPMINTGRAIDRLKAWLKSRFSWGRTPFPATLIDPEL